MLTIWIFLMRFFSYLYTGCGFYKLWSNVVRFFYERKYKNIKLHTFASLELLQAFMGYGSKWKADSWEYGFDTVSTPQKAQVLFEGIEKPTKNLDCDEHMIYAVHTIEKSLAAGLMKQEGIQNPKCLTVMWAEGWKGTGHNVCLLEHPQADGSVMYSFYDYGGRPSKAYKTIAEVAKLVRDLYGGPRHVGLCWVVSDKNLTPLIRHWG
jgi:hypothetical protein